MYMDTSRTWKQGCDFVKQGQQRDKKREKKLKKNFVFLTIKNICGGALVLVSLKEIFSFFVLHF